MDSKEDENELLFEDQIQSYSDNELSTRTYCHSLSEYEDKSTKKLRHKRSKSLCDFQLNEYTIGEIRRLHERLAARTPGTFRNVGPSFRDFSRSQVLTFICLSFVNFISFCSMSILAPFFPKEAAEKGMTPTMSGLVFSFYAFIIFIASPVMGKIIPAAGAKFVFTSGLFVAGGCNLLFGCLEYITDPMMFATYCFLVRGLEAFGAAAYSTSSYVFVVEIFPANIGAVLGFMETFVGLGMSIGPGLGGLLYSVGGFDLPFYTLGIILMMTVPVSLCLLPTIHYNEGPRKTDSIFLLLKNPTVLLIGAVVVVISMAWSFLDPTLEPHLRQFSLSSEKIGLIFLLFAGVYGISSPLFGWLSDKCRGPWLMMSLGLLSSSASLLLLGPTPLIPAFPSAPWLNILSLCILGASVALGLLPTFQGIQEAAITAGCKDERTTMSMVAGVWSSMYALGEVIGPLVGGIVTEHYNFAICCTGVAGLCALLGVGTAIYFFLHPHVTSGFFRSTDSDSGYSRSSTEDLTETTSLLQKYT